MSTHRLAPITALILALTACGETAKLTVLDGTGTTPTLPAPNPTLIPTVNIAPAQGWPEGGKPTPAQGTQVNAFATGLDHPRWVLTLPNGDVLVAESNAPPKPEDGKGIKGWVMKLVMAAPGPACRARTASRCCATPMATVSPTPAAASLTS